MKIHIAPKTPLVHRVGHYWKTFIFLIFLTFIFFMVCGFGLRQFTTETPRRIDLFHFFKPSMDGKPVLFPLSSPEKKFAEHI